MYQIKNGRWIITGDNYTGPEITQLLAVHSDGTQTHRIVVDRQSQQRTLGRQEFAPFDLSRKYGGTTLVDRLVQGSHRHSNGCILWGGAVDSSGHGVIGLPPRNGRQRFTSAHRLSFAINGGVLPAGLVVNHRCHSDDMLCKGGNTCQHRRCINPEHLELVSPKFNSSRALSRRWAA